MRDVSELKESIENAFKHLDITAKNTELQKLKEQSLTPNFWNDNKSATQVMQKITELQDLTEPWTNLQNEVTYLSEIAELNDNELGVEIQTKLEEISRKFESLKKILKFNGPYDSSSALLSIHAGAGGTDAQDWAQMLMRMYLRWAESNNIKTEVIEESSGDEAGIKSVSIEFPGLYMYGKLKGEHGVHRLVRLSPFNANNLRQTSFAKVEVLPKVNTPEEVPIDEKVLKIDVFRAGGKGGQSVNTTDSAVRITHLPTNIVISIQNERSQLQNKETAMTILRSKLAQLKEEQHLETLSGIKGPNQSAEWGNQIRSYVLHPYTMVKDLRTRYETSQAQAVLDGDIDPFIEAYLEQNLV